VKAGGDMMRDLKYQTTVLLRIWNIL